MKKRYKVLSLDIELVVTPEMVEPRTVGQGDYRFQKIFSEGEFIASGVLVLPKDGQKPAKNSHQSAMVYSINLDICDFARRSPS